jgi:hypothetical protein
VFVEKIWFIIISGNKEGPFSFIELKRDERITPDTLAWKQGFPDWLPIREIQELEDLFKDEQQAVPSENEELQPSTPPLQDNEVIALKKDPYFSLWVLLAVLLVVYVFYLLLNR